MKQTEAVQTSEIRELKKLIEGITLNFKNSFVKCLRAGELLTKIRSETKHGDWDDVLQAVGVSYNTARRYIAVWERRTELNLHEIETLSDAENAFAKISRLEIATTQNEALTHEKNTKSEARSDVSNSRNAEPDRTPGRAAKAVPDKGRGQFADTPPRAVPGGNSWPYLSNVSPPAAFHVERDEVDPADKISRSTPGDVTAARSVSEVYPKRIFFDALNREEEDSYGVWYAALLVKRGQKNGHKKIDLHEAIRSVCSAYKRVTGKTLSVKPLDAGQLRRLLESGITLKEFIEVGEKSWVSKGFLSHQSHQLAMFVKHYGNIRNEIDAETDKQEAVRSVNPQNYLNL